MVTRDPTPAQLVAEERLRRACERAMGIPLHSMPIMSVIDWFGIDNTGRKVACWVEGKCYSYASTEYPTALLSVTKYNALHAHSVIYQVPAYFVVGYTDGVRYIDVRHVDPARPDVVTRRDMRHPSDTEPIIRVPVADMRCLEVAHNGQ
jgi:hypothetical protein